MLSWSCRSSVGVLSAAIEFGAPRVAPGALVLEFLRPQAVGHDRARLRASALPRSAKQPLPFQVSWSV